MRFSSVILSCAVMLTLTTISNAQQIRLTLHDGSQVRGQLLSPSITVSTPYGPLVVPSSQIRNITFGIHDPDEATTSKLVKALGSDVHKEREMAQARLIALGRCALPQIRLAMKSADMESKTRAEAVYAAICERDSDAAGAPSLDTVTAADMVVSGRIKADSIRVKSAALGELSVRLADCKSVAFFGVNVASLSVDAAKDWQDSGVDLSNGSKLRITATGTVDLWPMGPGQYLAKASGYNTAGKGGQFMAGALVGKIGENGKSFYVGERFDGAAESEGRLMLLIVPSPWNNASSGSFKVDVRAD